MIVTHHNPANDTYSAATAVALLVHNLPREQAHAAILSAVEGVTPEQVDAWLDSPSDPATFRATAFAALANELKETSAIVETLPTCEAVDLVNEQLDRMGRNLQTLRDELERERNLSELRQLEQALERRAEKAIAGMAAAGFPNADTGVWQELMSQQMGQRVIALREALAQ